MLVSVASVVRVSLSGCGLDDVIHSDDHFCRFGRAQQHLPFDLVRLCDSQLFDVRHYAIGHICNRYTIPCTAHASVMLLLKLLINIKKTKTEQDFLIWYFTHY